MNYLAHAFLSFGHHEILVGNMISDFVKGKKKFDYPINIQKGIALHREIDAFADEHPATRLAKTVFKPHYRLYSAPFMDIVYDHFLALDNDRFSLLPLDHFSRDVYHILDQYEQLFPETFGFIYPYMKKHNWLFNYQYFHAIEKSFGGLARRATYITEGETAFRLFNENYQFLQQCYMDFFPALEKFSRTSFESLGLGAGD